MGSKSISDSSLPEADQVCMPSVSSPNSSRKGKNASHNTIVISDSELEEGEIDFEEKKQVHVKDRLRYPSSVSSLSLEDDSKDLPSGPEEYESVSRIKKFEWKDLRILIIGDERSSAYNWQDYSCFPHQVFYNKPFATLRSLCWLASRHLSKSFDIVLIMGFHHDIVNIDHTCNGELIRMKTAVDYGEIMNVVEEFDKKWKDEFPELIVVWVIPHPLDFLSYNFSISASLHSVDIKESHRQTLEYYKALVDINDRLAKLECYDNLIIFNLSDVLFDTRPILEKTFQYSDGIPKFPEGYLEKGLHPSKLMVMYCAHLLIEQLHFVGYYEQNKVGLDIETAEKQLVFFYPEFERFLPSLLSKKSDKRSKRRRRHSSSGSSSSRHRSLSHSRSRHGSSHRKSKRRKSKHRSHHHHKRHYHRRQSRSCSYSSSRSKSPALPPLSLSNKESSVSSKKLADSTSKKGNHEREKSVSSKKTADSTSKKGNHESDGEAVKFWKALRSLQECHRIECKYYRQNPTEHPLYSSEKKKFIDTMNSPALKDFGHLIDWEAFWQKKMEEIFVENWSNKDDRLKVDFQRLCKNDPEITAYLRIASPKSSKLHADKLCSSKVLPASTSNSTEAASSVSKPLFPLAQISPASISASNEINLCKDLENNLASQSVLPDNSKSQVSSSSGWVSFSANKATSGSENRLLKILEEDVNFKKDLPTSSEKEVPPSCVSSPTTPSSPNVNSISSKLDKNKLSIKEYLALRKSNATDKKPPFNTPNKDNPQLSCDNGSLDLKISNINTSKGVTSGDKLHQDNSIQFIEKDEVPPLPSSPAPIHPPTPPSYPSPPQPQENEPSPSNSLEILDEDFNIEIDVDKLFENPDVLKGLEDIDSALNATIDLKDISTEGSLEMEWTCTSQDWESDSTPSQVKPKFVSPRTPVNLNKQNGGHVEDVTESYKLQNIIVHQDGLYNKSAADKNCKITNEVGGENIPKQTDLFNKETNTSQLPSSKDSTSTFLNSSERKTSQLPTLYKNASNCDFIPIVKLLNRLSNYLGPFAGSISTLYYSILDSICKGNDGLEILDSDAKSILKLCLGRLHSSLKDNTNEVQKAILREAAERLTTFIDSLDQPKNKFPKIQIGNIATATVGQDVAKIVLFIKKTMLYHEYKSYSSSDIMNIYMLVRSEHLNMMKSKKDDG